MGRTFIFQISMMLCIAEVEEKIDGKKYKRQGRKIV